MYFVEHWLLATAVPAPAGVGGMTTVVSWKGGGHPLWEGEAIYPLASKLEQLGLDWRFSRMVAGPCYQASNPTSEPSARPHLCLPAYLHPKLFIEAQLGWQNISKSQKQKQLVSNKSFSLVPILGLFFIYIFSLSIHSLIHPCIHVIQMINLSSASSS